MRFKTWYEQNEPIIYQTWIADARSYTSGRHAWGDEPEEPARPCADKLDWELHYKDLLPEFEQVLVDIQSVVVSDYSGFVSYHECSDSFNIDLYFDASSDIAQRMIELKPDDFQESPSIPEPKSKTYGQGRIVFPFQGYQHAIITTLDKFNLGSNPPKEFGVDPQPAPVKQQPSGGREEYWRQIMKDVEDREFRKRPLEGD